MLKLSDFHPYQHNAVTELFEHDTMLAIMPTGAGKTAVGLTAFAELQSEGVVRRGIVLAPKRVAETVWPPEAALWEQLHHLDVMAVTGTPKQRHVRINDPDRDLLCIGINNIVWLYDEVCTWDKDDPRLDLLIFDESSKANNPRGVWAKTYRKLSAKFKHLWNMTGSPRVNKPQDYFVSMAALSRNELWGRSFDKWQRKNFYPTDYEQRNWEIHRHYIEELNTDVAKYSFKVPMSAVPRPASDPIIHTVQLPAVSRIKYKKMEREFFANVDETEVFALNSAVASGKLAQMAQGFLYDEEKVAHHLHHAKMDVLTELVNGTGDASAIIYWFEEDLVRLKDALPELVVLGEGGADMEAAWNAGNIQHMAIHPASCGHGINLQKTTAQLVHYALTWSAEMYDQVVARIARQGYVGDKKEWMVLNHHIVAEDTVDEMKMSRVKGKLTAQQAAMQYIKSV